MRDERTPKGRLQGGYGADGTSKKEISYMFLNGRFSVSRVRNSHILSTPLYLHTVYFNCHNYVIIVDIVPCSNNDSFLRVNIFLLQYCTKKKQYQSSVTYLILNNLPFVRCLTLVLRIVL